MTTYREHRPASEVLWELVAAGHVDAETVASCCGLDVESVDVESVDVDRMSGVVIATYVY